MSSPSVDRVFVDTNVLAYAHLREAPLHLAAVKKLQELEYAGSELWIARQSLREFLVAMTLSDELAGTVPIPPLLDEVRFLTRRYQVAEDGPKVTENLLFLMSTVPLRGKQVHDAAIVAIMQANNIAKLLTHNTADFARFGSIITVLPLVPES